VARFDQVTDVSDAERDTAWERVLAGQLEEVCAGMIEHEEPGPNFFANVA
jgi:hypothetical protein